MPEIKFEFKNTVDKSKIQDVLKKCKARILVGWPSGRQHMQALHGRQDDGKRISASAVSEREDGTAIETWELAKELHFGSPRTPPRPFFEDTLKQEETKSGLRNAFQEQIIKICEGVKPNWQKIGVMTVGEVQKLVRSDYYKTKMPNSKETIEAKGSDIPLIDGGDLVNSLTSIVEDS